MRENKYLPSKEDFKAYLDDNYLPYEIGGTSFYASDVLEGLDPEAFRDEYNDWLDDLVQDVLEQAHEYRTLFEQFEAQYKGTAYWVTEVEPTFEEAIREVEYCTGKITDPRDRETWCGYVVQTVLL